MTGQLEVCVTGPWPINGPAVHVTPQAKELLVRLGWTPPKEEGQQASRLHLGYTSTVAEVQTCKHVYHPEPSGRGIGYDDVCRKCGFIVNAKPIC